MAVAGMRAIYAGLPAPFGAGADPLATNLLPLPFLLPTQLIETFPNAGVTLHRAYGVISAGLTLHVALRTRAIDGALHEAVAAGAKQVVVLGAGHDGRAFRVLELEGLRVFEVDHPSTQRDKQNRLAKTTLRSLADVSFVPVDFEKDRLDECLV
jgi:methyltransferase (TIGR00027 family)